MPEADETIITRIVAETSDFIKNTTQVRAEVDAIKVKLRAMAQATKQDLKTVEKGFLDTAKATSEFTNKMGKLDTAKFARFRGLTTQALREIQKEEGKTVNATKTLGASFSNLGDISKWVFGSILGLGAVQALRNVTRWFGEAASKGLELSVAIFKLGASTRALQKQGLALTIADVTRKIEKLREEFGVFSRKELVDGIGQVQLYTRQLGFSVDQMDQMTDSIATLAIVMGKDFGETARSVALFLSSGYGEALQRAGIVDANRATVAQELLALGFEKSFNEATQQERALAGLNILLRGTADLSGEVEKFQESMAGQMRLATAEIKTQEEVIGQKLIPITLEWKRLFAGIITAYANLVESLQRFGIAIRSFFVGTFTGLVELTEQAQKLGRGVSLDEFTETIKRSIAESKEELEKAHFIYKDLGKDIGKGIGKGIEEGLEIDITPFFDELSDEIEEEQERLANRLAKLARDLQNDLDRIDRQALNKRLDLWTDYWNKLVDISRKEAQRVEDAIRRAALQRAQAIRKANLRRDDINRKYRERELKAERDFQEAMRRLREDFLLDLEDALRERDALQVLRLTKRYNLEQDRLRREREDERGDLDRQRKEELQDLERQTQERLRVIQEGLAAQLESIRIAAERERADAFIAYQRKLEDERIAEERREEERNIRAKEQAAEEEKRAQERLEAYALELAEKEGLTEEAVNALVTLLADTYGEGGLVQGVIGGLEQALIAANEAVAESARAMALEIMRAIAQIRALNNMSVSSPNPPSSPGGGGYAEGGTLVANEPTTVTFGEAGLEMATFTPLNRIGRDEGKIFGDTIPSLDGGKGSGKLALEILLSHGLEARIVETALDEVADVIVNVQRKR